MGKFMIIERRYNTLQQGLDSGWLTWADRGVLVKHKNAQKEVTDKGQIDSLYIWEDHQYFCRVDIESDGPERGGNYQIRGLIEEGIEINSGIIPITPGQHIDIDSLTLLARYDKLKIKLPRVIATVIGT
ncbi:hypothetical protein A3D00_02440 [Candidatus Woesebacteria bacterium RIFCSPHIGHO2_02_FULL_38_9]|uniref:Uncharacterized protein n=1 Tax=Candidatus Woesebacteria bacterium RIFCSPHIGHO2_01_FULL_39_28 TaxID=1802496 RepID=A0A1F7YBH2_9BACT|nr:MAG: hypothetical protein A2627_02700 [Candidatus Woesebacteria bacterium RIFCSPHIGHO2_01_FULL_39_28]OGM31582.1 MAG: hypothetical protein A3D00_02440 [Candidatus Woesebacteria bacterium RIFCSPHIGHO2_02_FULL_38_9]OGM58412.1 MAG: hypothetical protein A3A50_02625 [Candidatus Woesebacteria bacterium RIFCSPLOWO2_01_FULL_38_20]